MQYEHIELLTNINKFGQTASVATVLRKRVRHKTDCAVFMGCSPSFPREYRPIAYEPQCRFTDTGKLHESEGKAETSW